MAYVAAICGLHAPISRMFFAFAAVAAACRSGLIEDLCEATALALRAPEEVAEVEEEEAQFALNAGPGAACSRGARVRCPLCRTPSLAAAAIVVSGADCALPKCCVCLSVTSRVCLPCGHICLCSACFDKVIEASVDGDGDETRNHRESSSSSSSSNSSSSVSSTSSSSSSSSSSSALSSSGSSNALLAESLNSESSAEFGNGEVISEAEEERQQRRSSESSLSSASSVLSVDNDSEESMVGGGGDAADCSFSESPAESDEDKSSFDVVRRRNKKKRAMSL